MKCPNCGSEVGVQDQFCGSCGQFLHPQNTAYVQDARKQEKKSRGLFGAAILLGAVDGEDDGRACPDMGFDEIFVIH